MISRLKASLYRLLRRSEKYTKVDMVSLASGNFWLTGGRFIAIGSGMLLTVAFANLLSPTIFGTYKYVLAMATIIGAFTLNGLGSAIQKAVAQGDKNGVPGAVRAAILWSLPASGIAACIGAYYFFQGNNTLGWGFIFIATTNAISTGAGFSKSILLGQGNFRFLALSGIPRTLFPIIAIIGTLFLTKNIIYILFVYFLSNTVASWILYRLVLHKEKIQDEPNIAPKIIRFGTHMSVIGFAMLVSGQANQLLLWHFTGPEALVVFALALMPVQELYGLLNNFFNIAFPRFAAKTEDELRAIIPTRLKQMFFISFFAFLIYIVCVPYLFKYLFPKYLASIFMSQVLALIILLQPRGIFDIFITTHGNISQRYKVVVTTQIIEFVLACALIPFFGLWGAVAGIVFSEIVRAVSFYLMYRLTNKVSVTQS